MAGCPTSNVTMPHLGYAGAQYSQERYTSSFLQIEMRGVSVGGETVRAEGTARQASEGTFPFGTSIPVIQMQINQRTRIIRRVWNS